MYCSNSAEGSNSAPEISNSAEGSNSAPEISNSAEGSNSAPEISNSAEGSNSAPEERHHASFVSYHLSGDDTLGAVRIHPLEGFNLDVGGSSYIGQNSLSSGISLSFGSMREPSIGSVDSEVSGFDTDSIATVDNTSGTYEWPGL